MQAIQKREVTAEFRAEGVKLIIKQGPSESEVARARHVSNLRSKMDANRVGRSRFDVKSGRRRTDTQPPLTAI